MKKELYFCSDNIKAVSENILKKAKISSIVRPYSFFPEQSALIVLDMQEYFLNHNSHAFIPSSSAIIENINLIVKLFEEKKLPVIYTKHIDSESSGMMSKWWNGNISAEDEMSKISPQIICSNEKVITKKQYDAFYNTALEELLIQKSIKQLVITGVATNLCCENTARSAFIRGFEVMFPIDTTATYSFDFHLSSIINLSHGYSNIMLLEELSGKF